MGSKSSNSKSSRKADGQQHAAAINALSRDDFHQKYASSVLSNLRITLDGFTLHFETSKSISAEDLDACFNLVQETSGAAYQASNLGWSSSGKRQEMTDPNMKFLLLRNNRRDAIENESDGNNPDQLQGFLQFMITEEDDIEVMYCYEIHLQPAIQRKGVGDAMMNAMHAIGTSVGVEMAMLTVFVSNEAAIKFYDRIGYVWYDEEPLPPRKKLRGRVTEKLKPTYVILAKELEVNCKAVKS